MSGTDLNIWLISGVIVALAVLILLGRINKELDRQQQSRSRDANEPARPSSARSV